MKVLPERELDMVNEAIRDLTTRGFAYATEVALLNRSIDLVFQDDDANLVAVEFKRVDWRRAIYQARDHMLGADFVYICLPEAKINKKVEDEAHENGLGIFKWSIESPLEEHLPAERSEMILEAVRVWLLQRFHSRQDHDTHA